ncbi:hypothetical protein J6590_035588 [Homalodisca vitripennis]|nr:hypothetical protein J6590_035588 [Homalodisca vitripennis]
MQLLIERVIQDSLTPWSRSPDLDSLDSDLRGEAGTKPEICDRIERDNAVSGSRTAPRSARSARSGRAARATLQPTNRTHNYTNLASVLASFFQPFSSS